MQQKRNYDKEMDEIIEHFEEGQVPKLFLHSCCAPCSSAVFERLTKDFEITDFFYNPNISPESEYRKRTGEIQRLIDELPKEHPIHFVEGRYEPKEFYDMAKGLEDVPEGGERCFKCFALRLEESAKKAAEGGYDYFTTTLTISPLKNAAKLNEIGQEMGEKYGVKFLPSDFKKKNGYKRSTELSREYDLYRQDYCGCVFSKMQREREKAEKLQQEAGTEGN